jgi:hypothetical protein
MATYDGLIVLLVMTLPLAVLFALFAGIQRIPWRDGLVIGLGMETVLIAGGLVSSGTVRASDAGLLVFVAAIGGGIAVRGYERGKARRDARINAIVGSTEHATPT